MPHTKSSSKSLMMMIQQVLRRSPVASGRSFVAHRLRPVIRSAGTSTQPRIAIVTGGAQGLGEAISRALADGGDKVVVADVSEEKGRKVANSIGGSFVHSDVSDSSAVESLMKGVAATHGSVDVVVANAGIAPVPMAMHTITDEDWHKMLLINGFGTFLTCKHAVRQMLKQESGGVILAMSSVCGMTGHPGTASYNFSKAGVASLTKTIATEYSKHNIRMNCICPGTTNTPLVQQFVESCPQEVKETLQSLNPVPGMIQPSHVGQAAAMLYAPNKYLTGVALPIDGAWLACDPNHKLFDYVNQALEAEK